MRDRAGPGQASALSHWVPSQADFKILDEFIESVWKISRKPYKYFKEILVIYVKILRYLQSNFGQIVPYF